jgi:RNA polymerase sigma factor (sigma-70 family)
LRNGQSRDVGCAQPAKPARRECAPKGRGTQDPALDALIDRFNRRARAITGFYGIPVQEADDLLQQTYLAYLNKRDEVRNPEAWLAGTLRQRCLMFWRSRRRSWLSTVPDEFLEATIGPEVLPQDQMMLRHDLSLAVSRLPSRWQDLINLKYGLGLDSRETARRLGYRYSGIYTITKRCLAALAVEMESLGWECELSHACPRPGRDRGD